MESPIISTGGSSAARPTPATATQTIAANQKLIAPFFMSFSS